MTWPTVRGDIQLPVMSLKKYVADLSTFQGKMNSVISTLGVQSRRGSEFD